MALMWLAFSVHFYYIYQILLLDFPRVWFQDQCSRSGSKTSAMGLVPRLVQWVWFQD